MSISGGIKRLDHVNLRTGQLAVMIAWYRDVLGMQPGDRPNFPFNGAWMYAGTHALVHLVEREVAPTGPQDDLHLEHVAFSATGLREMLARAEAAGARTRLAKVPGFPVVQLNIWDPDDNHLHVDFDPSEAEGLDLA